MKKLTAKEEAELHRLDRKILGGKPVNRKQIDRAFELRRRKHATEGASG